MNVLIVEDDAEKTESIVAVLRQENIADHLISVERALHPGWKRLKETSFDLLLLDLNLPLYEAKKGELGGRPPILAGREILYRMKQTGREVPTIVITMFDRFVEPSRVITFEDLAQEFSSSYGGFVRGFIYYATATESWKKKLVDAIRSVKGES